MRLAALIVGVIGGVLGVLTAVLMVAGVNASGGGAILYVRALIAMAVFVGGIVGGALSQGYTDTAYKLQLVSGIVGGLLTFPLGILAGPMLLVGGVLAYFGRAETARGSTTS